MIDLKGYIIRLSIFSAILFVLSLMFFFIADEKLLSDVFLLFVPFFLFAGVLTRMILVKASKNNGTRFSLAYLAGSIGRLIIFGMLMILYAMFFREDAYPFMIAFFIYYLFYAFFDVILLHRSMHKST